MNNKLLSAILIAWITATWFASLSSASDNASNTSTSTWKMQFHKWDFGQRWDFANKGFGKWNFFDAMTDDEKTAFETMTQDEKKDYMENKRIENEEKMQAREDVIDALLAWKTLTSEQQTIKAEIIKERAERKAIMQERKANMEAIKTILEKKKSWSTLTEEEQTKLDELSNKSWFWHWKWNKWNKWFNMQ